MAPEAVQSVWGGMDGTQRFAVPGGLGLAFAGLIGMFSGGAMSWIGPLMAALGLGGAAYGATGGNLGRLGETGQGGFWSQLMGNQSPTQQRPIGRPAATFAGDGCFCVADTCRNRHRVGPRVVALADPSALRGTVRSRGILPLTSSGRHARCSWSRRAHRSLSGNRSAADLWEATP